MLSYISRFTPLIKHYRYHRNYRHILPVINIPNRYYHKNIVEHYENPRNMGSLDKNKRSVGIGLVGAPACGDVMKLSIDVDDYGVITDAKFKTFGCGSAIASSSYITCLLYTSPSPRDRQKSRMPSSA